MINIAIPIIVATTPADNISKIISLASTINHSFP
nr:MAG TPA: hypothetical protein [Caudoviricetes sp.]